MPASTFTSPRRLAWTLRPGFPRSIEGGRPFSLAYDILVLAPGAVNNTFGIPGVRENALFLKELVDARRIRERLVACLEEAALPSTTPEERARLLHFVVVGGGPTGVELAAELRDLWENDIGKSYPTVAKDLRITLFEAGKSILNQFDDRLAYYAMEHFRRQGIELRLDSPVARVEPGRLLLKTGEAVPAGLIVWSTGYAPTEFTRSLPFEKDPAGRVFTDDRLRVRNWQDHYALGDCAALEGTPLPQTAQVAMQEGKYLGDALNGLARGREPKPFSFVNLGMLAYIGESEALADLPKLHVTGKGIATFLFWRSAYLTRLVTLKNKVQVIFDWSKALVFGRDLSKF